MNNLVKQIEERHLAKKRVNIIRRSISKKITMKDSFQKKDVTHKKLLEDLGLLIVKNSLSINFQKV
jgi:hypothetical protein